jgi:hypothetical protein
VDSAPAHIDRPERVLDGLATDAHRRRDRVQTLLIGPPRVELRASVSHPCSCGRSSRSRPDSCHRGSNAAGEGCSDLSVSANRLACLPARDLGRAPDQLCFDRWCATQVARVPTYAEASERHFQLLRCDLRTGGVPDIDKCREVVDRRAILTPFRG